MKGAKVADYIPKENASRLLKYMIKCRDRVMRAITWSWMDRRNEFRTCQLLKLRQCREDVNWKRIF